MFQARTPCFADDDSGVHYGPGALLPPALCRRWARKQGRVGVVCSAEAERIGAALYPACQPQGPLRQPGGHLVPGALLAFRGAEYRSTSANPQKPA